MTTFIGIDPGKKGAIAIIDDAVTVHKAPVVESKKGKTGYDEPGMWDFLRHIEHGFTAIEQVQSFPEQGSSSAVSIGFGQGLWRGMLVAAGIPYHVVGPRTWQKALLVDVDKSDTKAASIIVAKRLFPGVSLRATDRCQKDDHNMADALLIAEYARREHQGGNR